MADVEEELSEKTKQIARARNRISISAEVFGKYNKPKKFTAPVFQKTLEQEQNIRSCILKCFLFSSVDKNDLEILVKAFGTETARAGDIIIKQGDDGEKLYLIESGVADFTKKSNITGQVQHLCTMSVGECFGELALMYNAPRAATVTAKTDMNLWTLDRLTFNRIVKASVVKKRERFDELLRNVTLFKNLDPYDRCRLADSLIEHTFEDENIITEGETGTCMYMILEGSAEAYIEGKLVKSYSKGDYFGEIALIEQKPRASTVVAKVSTMGGLTTY